MASDANDGHPARGSNSRGKPHRTVSDPQTRVLLAGDLVACAGGSSGKAQCIDGWISDAAALIDSKDVGYARTLIDYYLENYLRNPSERVRGFCSD